MKSKKEHVFVQNDNKDSLAGRTRLKKDLPIYSVILVKMLHFFPKHFRPLICAVVTDCFMIIYFVWKKNQKSQVNLFLSFFIFEMTIKALAYNLIFGLW